MRAMAQCLRALDALPENLVWFPTLTRKFKTIWSCSSMGSPALLWLTDYIYVVCRDIHRPKHLYIFFKLFLAISNVLCRFPNEQSDLCINKCQETEFFIYVKTCIIVCKLKWGSIVSYFKTLWHSDSTDEITKTYNQRTCFLVFSSRYYV